MPTAEALAAGRDLEVLAHVSITDPLEGLLVDNDRPFTVKGVGNSYEGNVVTRIQRWEGTDVVAEKPTIAGRRTGSSRSRSPSTSPTSRRATTW